MKARLTQEGHMKKSSKNCLQVVRFESALGTSYTVRPTLVLARMNIAILAVTFRRALLLDLVVTITYGSQLVSRTS